MERYYGRKPRKELTSYLNNNKRKPNNNRKNQKPNTNETNNNNNQIRRSSRMRSNNPILIFGNPLPHRQIQGTSLRKLTTNPTSLRRNEYGRNERGVKEESDDTVITKVTAVKTRNCVNPKTQPSTINALTFEVNLL